MHVRWFLITGRIRLVSVKWSGLSVHFARSPMPKQHIALLLVALLLVGVAHAQCPTYSVGQTLWSTAYPSLQAGADVVITSTVWLDTSTPVLGDIEIQNGGALYFKPGSGAISLRAHQIYIRSGGTHFPELNS